LFSEKALGTVFILLLGALLFFSLIIRILEWDNPFSDFSDFFNCVWFIFITMVTVGYGDYTPITAYG